MSSNLGDKYEAIIIGAGIGGLVCGCYLAKAGKKVLIIERRANVGGCCTSFSSNGYTFDAFAHSIGGLRKNGVFDIVFHDLKLKNRIKIHRHDPSDIFVTSDYKVCFWNDLNQTKDILKSLFPAESSNIDSLLEYLAYSKGGSSLELRNLTFLDFLKSFIKNKKLISLLSMPVLGNAGLPPSMISAFTATKLYQEFHFDGGYYPEGGMQNLANLFEKRFKEYGGEVILSNAVERLLFTSNGEIKGVRLKNGVNVLSSTVVSNIDPKQTFNDFIGTSDLSLPDIRKMRPSSSVYTVFLGVGEDIISKNKELLATTWHMLDYDIEKMYSYACNGNFKKILWFMVFASPDKKGLAVSILAPFKTDRFWLENKRNIFDNLLSVIKMRLSFLNNNQVKHKIIITPQTINRWTSNFQGAAYGWESTPSQFIVPGFTQTTCVKGLFLTGHWTTQTIGVSGVAYMGRDTAKIILGRKKR